MDLREFLAAAELDYYYSHLHDGLKVASVAHIKYVDDQDLVGIGMSKPEIRRLRQFHKKVCPQGALGKLKKVYTTSVLSVPIVVCFRPCPIFLATHVIFVL